ncbi:hypothetical protein [Niabella beijingensis]|uniref:hypothetical protein n=1 Tax=Niabella beijingensis TaxID=2872700 RepID=UPI001CC16BBB|nr:hypothetical protein [Niabella beijingensis]MBZ4187668.1 hypothetical protein [Niabella beijingensis]
MYIHFYHGRKTIEEELNDWGEDGPIVSVSFISWTYGNLKLHDETDDFTFLSQAEDLIPLGNMYYGDFELLPDGDPWVNGRPVISIKEFENLNQKQWL